MLRLVLFSFSLACWAQPSREPVEGDWIARDFEFQSGEKLAEVRLHYITLGAPARDANGRVRNAVLILHGTGGNGRGFLSANFGGELFGEGQPLDAARYFIILPDGIGHGKSTKPSDGLHARFPHYDYDDMVRGHYRLLTEGLKVDHLRLVMGTSMGAMHSWVWGEMYPDFMDALMPLASAPVQIAGRNRMFRQMVIDAIRGDPEWKDGEYTSPPRGIIAAHYALFMMTSSPMQLHHTAPTRDLADAEFERLKQRALRTDANDMLYAFDSSRNYDPSPKLESIKAPLLAINSADDEVNPPELAILEREIKRVPHGRFVLIPTSEETRGHGTHSRAALWKQYVDEMVEQKFRVKVATTQGDFVIEAHRDWAPYGVDRLSELVTAAYFDDSRFFRVRAGYIAQFGIAGNPTTARQWRDKTFPDDPVKQSNVRGTLGYAMTGPDTRGTQIYINLGDNRRLDAEGFAPIGRVIEGMDVVDKLYSGYGENAGGGMRGGKQAHLFEEGNSYLDREFPKLDKLLLVVRLQ